MAMDEVMGEEGRRDKSNRAMSRPRKSGFVGQRYAAGPDDGTSAPTGRLMSDWATYLAGGGRKP